MSAIIVDVLHGLHAAHEATDRHGRPLGVVHRDVWPQNVIVGEEGVARVLDFGIAKAVDTVQHTHTGLIRGKAAYMAPEQLFSTRVSRGTDLYAVGLILWELWVGARLYPRGDRPELLSREPMSVEAPSRRSARVTADVDAVLARATHPNPDERFESGLAMASAMEALGPMASRAIIADWVQSVAGKVMGERAALAAAVESAGASIRPEADAEELEDVPLDLRFPAPPTGESLVRPTPQVRAQLGAAPAAVQPSASEPERQLCSAVHDRCSGASSLQGGGLLADMRAQLARVPTLWVAAFSFVAVLCASTFALADVNVCVEAHSEGQLARDEGRLTAAQTSFRQCAATECPGPIQKECSELLAEVDASLPSVVLSARDEDGNDVLDVAVTLDGEPISDPLSGLAIPIDPGRHRFEFKRPDGTTVNVDMVAQEGVQRRPVTAVFEVDAPEAATVPKEPKAPPVTRDESSGFVGKPLGLVLAGVGTVALGGFAYFALDGKSRQSELERTCAPNCSEAQRGEVEQTYLLADIALVASALSYSGAAYFYFTAAPNPSAETGSLSWSVGARGRF